MSLQVTALSNEYGFINDPVGAHSSRTMMLAELRLLLAACPQSASFEEYRSAIIDEHVLLKKPVASRKASFKWLRELYALDRKTLLFRALRDLWDEDTQAQPLLALLSAVARDPLLRSTAESILAILIGETVTPEMMMDAVNVSFPDRYSPKTLKSTGRNIISSWQQAGLLSGKLHKVRMSAQSLPASVTYALLLAYLSDERAVALLPTLSFRFLHPPLPTLPPQPLF